MAGCRWRMACCSGVASQLSPVDPGRFTVGAGIEQEGRRFNRSRSDGPDQRSPRATSLIGPLAAGEKLAERCDVVADGGLSERSPGVLGAGGSGEQRGSEPEPTDEMVHGNLVGHYTEVTLCGKVTGRRQLTTLIARGRPAR